MEILVIALLIACAVQLIFIIKYKKQFAAESLEKEQLLNDVNVAREKINDVSSQLFDYKKKYEPIIKLDEAIIYRNEDLSKKEEDIITLSNKYKSALEIYNALEKEVALYTDTLEINEFGLHQPVYSFDLSEQYKLELENNYQKQKKLVSSGDAAVCYSEWTVGGSVVEGRKMTKHYTKLMLYAFNGECDALIAKVKWNNFTKTKERIQKAFDNINKLGTLHNVYITDEYLELKLDELTLTYEYEQKKHDEKEEQRRIREQMREDEKAQKEYERAQKEAEDEEKKYLRSIEKAKKDLGMASQEEVEELTNKIKILEENLQEAIDKKQRAISMAQMTKAGHIYVISNIGSFGEDVYKIGMTRRLDPLDRVKELGDASVPFYFDVHAVIYSENAPQLEYELHRKFSDRRLNKINNRKEFFKISLDEIEVFVNQHHDAEIQFTKLSEAKEYRETLKLLEQINNVLQKQEETKLFPKDIV